MYISKFYDADSNGSADILNIDADFDQTIDFHSNPAPLQPSIFNFWTLKLPSL